MFNALVLQQPENSSLCLRTSVTLDWYAQKFLHQAHARGGVGTAERDFAQCLILDGADALLGEQQGNRKIACGDAIFFVCVGLGRYIDRLMEFQSPTAEIEGARMDGH